MSEQELEVVKIKARMWELRQLSDQMNVEYQQLFAKLTELLKPAAEPAPAPDAPAAEPAK